MTSYNLRLGTQTFAGRYQFTTNTLLVETAQAIRAMGSDILKFYLGRDYPRQYRIRLGPGITNLTTLVRDEPSVRTVLGLPFRHVFAWAYSFTPGGDTYWKDGMSATEQAREYAEMHALTRHLLTCYSGTGKRFYLGHWEGDWHLLTDYVTTNNPSPTAIQGLRDWLNTRQRAVDDARRETPHAGVDVFLYAEVNRVRDAMLHGPASNQRLVNAVLPGVPDLDYVSWSSYDGQDLDRAELHRTLDYIESQLSTHKAARIPGRRVFVGEYGWGSLSPEAQEPRVRAYLGRLLDWGVPFALFWEIYNNEPGRAFALIDEQGRPTPTHGLHARFLLEARQAVARFAETHGRVPTATEFAALALPLLAKPGR